VRDIFIKACNGLKTDYTPVWFMRQAGRYMPEYQKVRQKYDFLTMCRTPEIAAEVTMQPVRILDVDAAILFSDILIPLEAMGMKIEFIEEKGPQVHPAIRTSAQLSQLKPIEIEKIQYVFEAIRILIRELNVPLIGFAASPFTLATYIIEGTSSKDFINSKKFMFSDKESFHKLMATLTDSMLLYLKEQLKAGVNAIQIFDTWAGILSPFDYELFVKPYVKRLTEGLKSVPVIYFCPNATGLANQINETEADVLSIDWRIDISDASRLFREKTIQGNLDPLTLLGSEDEIFKRTTYILTGGRKARSHIFNLGHGVNIHTKVDTLKKLVDFVHNFKHKEE
jgi:uroporphyrinogen decarboxylase